MLICSSPQLFAACHVLLRRLMPRHPPYALSSLISRSHSPFPLSASGSRSRSSPLCFRISVSLLTFTKSLSSLLQDPTLVFRVSLFPELRRFHSIFSNTNYSLLSSFAFSRFTLRLLFLLLFLFSCQCASRSRLSGRRPFQRDSLIIIL